MRFKLLTSSAAIAVLLAACGEREPATAEVDEATGDEALAALHLASSGDGSVSWASRSFEDGVYTFTDVVFADLAPAEDADEAEAEAEEAPADEGGKGPGQSAGDDTAETDTDSGVEFDTIRAERMVLAAPRFDADGNVVFDRLSIENATFDNAEGEGPEEGGFDAFIIEAPNAVMVADIARGFSGEDSSEDEEVDFSAYRFGIFAIEGLAMASTEPGEEFELALGRFALEGYEGDSLALFEVSDVRIEGSSPDTGPIVIAFDEMVMENLGPSLMTSFDRSFASAMAEGVSGELVEQPEAIDPESYNPFDSYDSFRFTGLDMNVGGVLVTMESMTAEIDEGRNEVVMTSAFTPLVVRPDTNQPFGAQLAMGLGMLGYQEIQLQGEGEAVYDRGDDRAYTRGENYVEMTDGFRIEAESDFSGYMAYAREALRLSSDMEAGNFDGENIMAMFDPLMINRFVLRVEDHSLLDRALTAGSAAQGVTKDELRQQAGAMIALGLMGVPAEVPRPLVSQLSAALVSFISEGGAITIAVEPEEPVSMGALLRAGQSGEFDYDAYGITISAEPAETEE